MSNEETVHVAAVSDGVGGDEDADPGEPVELPVVDVLTGRSFITGKSGSGKSNTASVLIENLLDNNFPVLIVDSDGEYYGLKEEYEILHVGADDECDIVVSPEHAKKIATLALDENVPIILDVSGYLEESVASELILNVVKHLFAKEKKLKKPFLLVVEECHEYIPEGGGMDETGKMLIKVGKRGRKHGLGIVGISQRPADVKKDFITQCDWLVWHRLTWDNDTNVVSRILGSQYADAIEDMDDGEAFLMSDWDESIRRIQFHRKKTFDAGATPGLEDFERPELKSVSGNLVTELETISEEQAQRESELADLRQELDKKRQRINELERELEDAKDLSRMADRFSQALLQRAQAPYRGGSGRNQIRDGPGDQSELNEYERDPASGVDPDETTASMEPTDREMAETVTETETGAETKTGTGTDATDANGSGDPMTVDPITGADVAESALRFDETFEVGTRQAVIETLRDRIGSLPAISTEMLRHYRTEGVSDPVSAHIAAGGDGDSEHAYARHRPLRRVGVVRHIDRDRYEYAIPNLIREAYAGRLDDETVSQTVEAIETSFVGTVDRGSSDTNTDTNTDTDTGTGTDTDTGVANAADPVHEGLDDENGSDVSDPGEATRTEPNTGLSEAARAIAAERMNGLSGRSLDAEPNGTERGSESQHSHRDEVDDEGESGTARFDPVADDAEIVDADE